MPHTHDSLITVEGLNIGDLIHIGPDDSFPMVVIGRYDQGSIHTAEIVEESKLRDPAAKIVEIQDTPVSYFGTIRIAQRAKYRRVIVKNDATAATEYHNEIVPLYSKENKFYGTNFTIGEKMYRLHPHEMPQGLAEELAEWIAQLEKELENWRNG